MLGQILAENDETKKQKTAKKKKETRRGTKYTRDTSE